MNNLSTEVWIALILFAAVGLSAAALTMRRRP
jgi:hypothetical protein